MNKKAFKNYTAREKPKICEDSTSQWKKSEKKKKKSGIIKTKIKQ